MLLLFKALLRYYRGVLTTISFALSSTITFHKATLTAPFAGVTHESGFLHINSSQPDFNFTPGEASPVAVPFPAALLGNTHQGSQFGQVWSCTPEVSTREAHWRWLQTFCSGSVHRQEPQHSSYGRAPRHADVYSGCKSEIGISPPETIPKTQKVKNLTAWLADHLH